MTTELTTDIAIIGAGLIGSSAALALRRAGLDVTLIERGHAGARASGVNFGGVRRQGRPIEQLYLAQRAHQIWPRLRELVGTDAEYVRSGHLKLARSPEDLEKLEAYQRHILAAGFDLGLEILDRAALRRRFPMLGTDIAGGSLCLDDGQANPRLAAPAFARAAQRAGARLLEHCEIVQADTQGERFLLVCADGRRIRAEYLVNAAGAWGATIAGWFGDAFPLRVKCPTMLVTEPMRPLVGVSLGVEGGGFYARQVARGNLVMGGGYAQILPGNRSRPGREALGGLGRQAAAILPAAARANAIRFWSGIEGYFDDKNPVIDFSPGTPRLLHAFGFSGNGFQISPAVGETLADLVQGKSSLMMAERFSARRWQAA